MNFEAIDKLSSPLVIKLLQEMNYRGTAQYLQITRNILDAFLDKSLSVERRIYLIWYSVLFLRAWRAWVLHDPNNTLGKNFISLNCYVCVEINAHGIILLAEKYRMQPQYFLPWLFGSQTCEKFFRQTRSMTPTQSTITMFDLLDILQRRHRIQAIDNIMSEAGA